MDSTIPNGEGSGRQFAIISSPKSGASPLELQSLEKQIESRANRLHEMKTGAAVVLAHIVGIEHDVLAKVVCNSPKSVAVPGVEPVAVVEFAGSILRPEFFLGAGLMLNQLFVTESEEQHPIQSLDSYDHLA